jgi:hypothetical protein
VSEETDLVIDRGDSRSQPCRSFRLLLLGPGPHLAFENCLTSLHLDGGVVGVDFCTANQRILDLLLQVSGRGERLYDNQTAYTLDTPEPACDAFDFLLLLMPYNFALERYPARFDRHLTLFGRNTGIPLKRLYRGRCDVGIRTLAYYAHCNIVGYGNHSVHVMGIFLCLARWPGGLAFTDVRLVFLRKQFVRGRRKTSRLMPRDPIVFGDTSI